MGTQGDFEGEPRESWRGSDGWAKPQPPGDTLWETAVRVAIARHRPALNALAAYDKYGFHAHKGSDPCKTCGLEKGNPIHGKQEDES